MADAEESKLFQPEHIVPERCRALMWNRGRGKLQCARKHLLGRDLCRWCEASDAPYGRVRGPIPAKIMEKFRKKALRSEGLSKQWYARHLMWEQASKMVPELEDLNEMDDRGQYKLTDEQYEKCLKRIQEHIQNIRPEKVRSMKWARGSEGVMIA